MSRLSWIYIQLDLKNVQERKNCEKSVVSNFRIFTLGFFWFVICFYHQLFDHRIVIYGGHWVQIKDK